MYTEKVRELLGKRYPEHSPLAFVHSFGCQQNKSDGERIKGILSELGYAFTDTQSDADIIIYNTCAVRENAELKVFGNIGELKHLKEKKPEIIIGICGCMTQQEHIAEKIKKTYKQVDIVFGTFAMAKLGEMIYKVLSDRKFTLDISDTDSGLHEDIKAIRDCSYKAGVPIMYGCNNFCSYCIVPYVRGRERSRTSDAVLSEVRELVANGCKEIMLLGQNVNSYGRGLEEKTDFPTLLRQIDAIDGDFRIRFMSSHPKDAGRELIDAIAECKKVCKHLHLPVQSGSNAVLEAMNRRYTVEDYKKIIDYAREKIPGFSVSTDIIVGFPNETEADFQKTLDLMEYVKFDSVFSFIYSKRSGTKAALIDDSTPAADKTLRMRKLLALQREISTNSYKRFIGRELTVLADATSSAEGYLSGKSDEYVIVEFQGSEDMLGSMVKVQITDAHNWALVGKII